MGKVSVVQFEGSETTLSLIKWGLFRKWRYGQDFISVTGAAFVPKYELAVFTCGSFSMPEVIFYFSSEKIALRRFDEIKAAIEQGGTCGEPIRDIVRKGKRREQYFFPHKWKGEEVPHGLYREALLARMASSHLGIGLVEGHPEPS